MDMVGPLPRTVSGNKYILVVCDYATRWPEAIPLKSTDSEQVAERQNSWSIFSVVLVFLMILTDQGANFTSSLITSLYNLMGVRPIKTSPYHPQTDGLVERFNGTLKSMLRKVTSWDQKNWDKYLPYLLFAYREVPQQATGYAPFELVYGRQPKGPILKQAWTSPENMASNVHRYLTTIQKRLEEMMTIAHESAKSLVRQAHQAS